MVDKTESKWDSVFKIGALYTQRSGQHEVRTAYVWEKSYERARTAAFRIFKGAKHIVIHKKGKGD